MPLPPVAQPMLGVDPNAAFEESESSVIAADAVAAITNTPRFPPRPKVDLNIDNTEVAESVVQRAMDLDQDANRGQWLDARLQRYAKFRGWLPDKSFPWPGASNVHPPLLQIAEMRTFAGLHNVVMTLRPLLKAQAQSRAGMDREEKITQVVDYQLFQEPGPELAERRLTDFIAGGLEDGNGVAYTPWVRDERRVTTVEYAPPVPPDQTPGSWLAQQFKRLVPLLASAELHASRDNVFFLTDEQNRTSTATVYQDSDGSLEIVLERETTIYDGPIALPLPIESVLVPTRCTNLQPPSEANPTGAPYVFLRWRYRLDDVRRMKRSGVFNRLDSEGLEKIEAAARDRAGMAASMPATGRSDDLQQQKDTIEGREHREVDSIRKQEDGHLNVQFLLAFDRWDVDGDGLGEDTFFVVAEDAKVLCEARLLTERWPAIKPFRPLAEWCPIPVKDRWYGVSLLELGESLYDLVKGTFDQSFDGWTVATLPFFFYGASSKLNQDVLSISPGQGTPVPGVPRETVYFPNLPQRDQQGALGIIGLALNFYQQLMSIGPLQVGQVPTGKASALRTTGTTMALLQQGDVRADQMLIRLFQGLAQIGLNFHRMNRRLLPKGKEIRVVGWEGAKYLGYRTIDGPGDIDAEAEFAFRPEFLSASPQVIRESLQALMTVMIQPLAFQLGVSNAQTVTRLMRDFVKALRLDPKRYVDEPTADLLPPILAEEAIQAIHRGQEPNGVPMEGAEKHLGKLFEWINSEAFGLLPPQYVELAKLWQEQVAKRAQQERLQAAAAAFQQAVQQGQGQQGVQTSMQEPSGGALTPQSNLEVPGA